eukprot:2697054-Rhodomonas_salina.4
MPYLRDSTPCPRTRVSTPCTPTPPPNHVTRSRCRLAECTPHTHAHTYETHLPANENKTREPDAGAVSGGQEPAVLARVDKDLPQRMPRPDPRPLVRVSRRREPQILAVALGGLEGFEGDEA